MGRAPEGNTPIDTSHHESRRLTNRMEHKITLGIPMRRPFKGDLAEEIDDGVDFDT